MATKEISILLLAKDLASGNIRATQALAMHADVRMTERYTLAAVDPALQAVVAQLGYRLPRSRNMRIAG